jgi:signal transduction histidine kinase
MAQTARSMNGAHLDRRLPSPDTHDELEDLSHAFNDLLNRLQESFERQQRFTGDASHQLRTPLTSMLGQIEVALRRGRSADDYRHVLNQVSEQAGRLHQIVEMLLFLARADAEAQFPQGEKLYLTVWLGDHLKARSGHKRADDLRLESSEKEPLWVLAQPALLGQLVDNLLDNACKYSQPGSPITLRVSREEQSVLLTVKDKGQGISADDIGHVFEPFYRSSEMRQKGIGGIGLGLSVARRIASAFGGSIEVKSEPGSGTEFVLRFPDPTDVTHDMNSSDCHNGPIVENRDRIQA